MKILLCASVTPDTTAKINFTADNKSLENSGVTFILNPYDDHALASAMDLKEKHGGTVSVIHVGQSNAEPILRKTLAVGADEAILVNAEPTDGLFVAQQIAAHAKQNNYDLIMVGRESIDFNGSEVGEILAQLLNIPSVSFTTKIDVSGSTFHLSRFIDGGEEDITVDGPVLISATKELAEPRIPNMRGIMSAKTKPLHTVEPAPEETKVEIDHFSKPQGKGGVKMIDAANAGELIEILHNEEKVI